MSVDVVMNQNVVLIPWNDIKKALNFIDSSKKYNWKKKHLMILGVVDGRFCGWFIRYSHICCTVLQLLILLYEMHSPAEKLDFVMSMSCEFAEGLVQV